MARRKFNIGDPVRFTDRAPKGLTEGKRKRTRKIATIDYDHKRDRSVYILGTNGGQHISHDEFFYSDELYNPTKELGKIGRPHRKVRMTPPNQRQRRQATNQVSNIKENPKRQFSGTTAIPEPKMGVSAQ